MSLIRTFACLYCHRDCSSSKRPRAPSTAIWIDRLPGTVPCCRLACVSGYNLKGSPCYSARQLHGATRWHELGTPGILVVSAALLCPGAVLARDVPRWIEALAKLEPEGNNRTSDRRQSKIEVGCVSLMHIYGQLVNCSMPLSETPQAEAQDKLLFG